MDLTRPLSSSPLRNASNADFGLRPFQRVTAQVLAVTGTTAVLAIEGHAVVAQLTSANQAAALLSQRTAHFIVTSHTGREIALKLVRHDQPGAIPAGTTGHGPEVAARLLEQTNISLNVNTLMLARSVLNQQLPLTPGLLTELLGALSQLGSWGQSQADLAVALKAAGLPVTVESLALAARQAAHSGEALGQLISQLQSSGQNLPPDLLKQIQQNLQMLEDLILIVDGDSARLAAQLKAAANMLGQSLESALLEQAHHPEKALHEKGLFSLAKLGQTLEQAGEKELAAAVERFLGDLRHYQFLNAKPESGHERETWSEIGFRLRGERGGFARLRVSHESRSNPGEIDPAFTHLILQVDVGEGQMVEVDLALGGKQICPQITSPDPLWCRQAESELPSLEQALQQLGFHVKDAKIEISEPTPFVGLKFASGGAPLMTVNIEV